MYKHKYLKYKKKYLDLRSDKSMQMGGMNDPTVPIYKRKAVRKSWGDLLTDRNPWFNTEPNAYMIEKLKNLKPGKALDVGMGQGRNSIYLAQKGWNVTGFDPEEKAVNLAKEKAVELGLQLTTFVKTMREFDFGENQWDLIVITYVGLPLIHKIYDSLKPGGSVIFEAFHKEDKNASVNVTFTKSELMDIFKEFNIIECLEVTDISDFPKGQKTKLVRLFATK